MAKYDAEAIRERSLREAVALGYQAAIPLPILGDERVERTVDEAFDRLLCLQLCAMCAYGCDPSLAREWAAQEGLESLLTSRERAFLQHPEEDAKERLQFQWAVEAIWELCWALSLVPEVGFVELRRGNELVDLLPDFSIPGSSQALRAKAKFRPDLEIVEKLDLAYCLHWAVNQGRLDGEAPPSSQMAEAIPEKRLALEWLICRDPWDDVDMMGQT